MKRLALLLLLLAPAPAVADDPHMTRDESLINAFQVMCFLGDPNFDTTDAKAAAMRMTNVGGTPPAGPPGVTTKGSIRRGGLTTGPFLLHLFEQSGAAGAVSSCGVSGQVPDADLFRDDMLRVMQLKPPVPTPGNDGSMASIWNDMPAPNHRLILRTGAKTGTEAGPTQVMITYSVKTTR